MKQGKTNNKEAFLWKIALRIEPLIKLSLYRRDKLQANLNSIGENIIPETYVAQTVAKGGIYLIGIVPSLFIFPPLAIAFILICVKVIFDEIHRVEKLLKEKREAIEFELPRLVLNIEQELKASRDVIRIIEKHKEKAGEGLKQELGITIADMKTGNQELALTKLDARVGSPMLSEVVRGLVGVVRGDDNVLYFQRLAHEFKQIEIQRLKVIAQKRPEQIRKYSFAMLVCFISVFVVALGMHLISAFNSVF